MRPPIVGEHFAITFTEQTGVVTLCEVEEVEAGGSDHNMIKVPGKPIHTFYKSQLACLEAVAFEANLRCQMEQAFKEALAEHRPIKQWPHAEGPHSEGSIPA